jgi:hypothetical protein
VAVSPRLADAGGGGWPVRGWQIWWAAQRRAGAEPLGNLLLVQVAVFEAVFLMAAVWRETPTWLVLILVWLGAYLSVYAALARRGERSAGVMAATWARDRGGGGLGAAAVAVCVHHWRGLCIGAAAGAHSDGYGVLFWQHLCVATRGNAEPDTAGGVSA